MENGRPVNIQGPLTFMIIKNKWGKKTNNKTKPQPHKMTTGTTYPFFINFTLI